MKRILFFFLLLPALASAQTAKDTVNVLTDAEITAGSLVDSVKLYYIQNSAWKKQTLDSLAKYMVVKNGTGVTTGDKGDITVNSATSWSIDAGVITGAKIASNAIDSTHIQADAVRTSEILNAAVTTAKIAADAVDSTKVIAGGLAGSDLADNAITSGKILNGAVTTAKIAADAVDSTKVIAGGLAGSDLADNAITGAKIAATTVTGNKLAITGISGDAAHLVGAISGGNADTVRVGSGLQLSSGELRADTAAMIIACSDETSNLTTGTKKVTFRAPFAFTILGLRANVKTAPTGANLIIDINEADNTIMTTNKIVIEASEKTSLDATTQPGITDTSIANDAEMTIDIDQIGSTVAGVALKVVILYRKN